MNDAAPNDDLAVARALEQVIGWLRDSRDVQGLSASALSALVRLDRVGSLRITELAEVEQLTQPGMTTLINRLEDAGYATRETDPADKRAVRVTITPAGVARVIEHKNARAALIHARIDELTPSDRQALEAAVPALRNFVSQPAPTKR